MSNPFEVLGLKPWAGPDEIRTAYRALVKSCHPDMIQDPAEKEAAQERMIRLNLAYEEALKFASPRVQTPAAEIPMEEAIYQAEKLIEKESPEKALRQLLRAEERDAKWYWIQGKALMMMDQYESAHQSFREAVRREPDNREYREGALDSALAMKKAATIGGRIKKLFKNKRK